MTGRLKKGKVYPIPTCYKCPSPEFKHGKTISPNDKNAHKLKDGSWICGDCVLNNLRKTTSLLSRGKGKVI